MASFLILPIEQKLEAALGLKQGKSKVDAAVAKAGATINGWQISGAPGDSAHYNGDWLARAVAAQAGIYGNSPEEAMYPFTRKDVTGRAIDGRKNYTLTFPADQLPLDREVLEVECLARLDADAGEPCPDLSLIRRRGRGPPNRLRA